MNYKLRALNPPASMIIGLLTSSLMVALSLGAPVATFDDVQFWAGTGSNRAAMVIDWDDATSANTALVWGYRWDGSASGAQMLETIVAADNRLFAKLNQPVGGNFLLLYGLGYDATNDGQFSLSDGTIFDADGFAVTGPADVALSTDPGDYYAEGWFTGFWHYGQSDGNMSPYAGGDWKHGGNGMVGRSLLDGDWDSWTFTPNLANETSFAENPHAAEVPIVADFDSDADTDGNDFLIWQHGHGILAGANLADGDADGDTDVDIHDLALWRIEFDSAASELAASIPGHRASTTIPEPTSIWLASLALTGFIGNRRFHRRFMNHLISLQLEFE